MKLVFRRFYKIVHAHLDVNGLRFIVVEFVSVSRVIEAAWAGAGHRDWLHLNVGILRSVCKCMCGNCVQLLTYVAQYHHCSTCILSVCEWVKERVNSCNYFCTAAAEMHSLFKSRTDNVTV